jgi:hypothetical protein
MMSTPEFIGIFLGLAMAIATVVFMMIGYESAIQREFRQMLTYLRLAGFLSLGGWIVMTAVIVKYNKDYSVLKAAKLFNAEPETRIVGQGISEPQAFTVTTKSGSIIEWENGYAGLQRGTGYFRSGSGRLRRSDGSSGYRVGVPQFPFAGVNDRHDEFTGVSAESDEDTGRF